MKKQLIYILCVFFTLTGCSTLRFDHVFRLSPSAEQYLQKATQTKGTEQQNYQLLAVNQLLIDGNLNAAQQLLNTLTPLNTVNYQQKQILFACLSLEQSKSKLAINRLHKIQNLRTLPTKVQAAYFITAIEAHWRNNSLAYSTLARISLSSLLQQQKVSQPILSPYAEKILEGDQDSIIWRNLQIISMGNIKLLLSRSSSPLLVGWLRLAIIAKTFSNAPNRLIANIKAWKKAFPNHPAQKIIADADKLQLASKNRMPSQIALLLPLHGKFANIGQAIRDGFMTAYYAGTKSLLQVPEIKIYDTSQQQDIKALYQQALQAGANFVIGPLTKSNVNALAHSDQISVPTIALNYLPKDASVPKHFIQFGLVPEQAAKQAADYAWQRGVNHLLIIASKTDWNSRVKQAFLDRWNQLGGKVIESITFSNNDRLSDVISSALHVDQSEERTKNIEGILKEKVRSIPWRRQDINGIFFLASSTQARQIRPLLKFYFAGDLPIFSISSIYSGIQHPIRDRDLDGVFFNDLPWLIGQNIQSKQLANEIQSYWPENYRINKRLYALGVDAFLLSMHFSRLKNLPHFALNGVTGLLFLSSHHRVYRQLPWAKFVKGIPVLQT